MDLVIILEVFCESVDISKGMRGRSTIMRPRINQLLFVFTAAMCSLMKLMMVLDFTVGFCWEICPSKVMSLKHTCVTNAHGKSGINKYS